MPRHLGQIERRFALDLDTTVHNAYLLVAIVSVETAPVKWSRWTGCVPLEVEGDWRWRAIRATKCLIGIVERCGVGLVPNRPLLHRSVPEVLGPHGLALDDKGVGAHRYSEVSDVQERSTGSRKCGPVPGRRSDDAMAGQQPDRAIDGPSGEHPFLDRSWMTAVVSTIGHIVSHSGRLGAVSDTSNSAEFTDDAPAADATANDTNEATLNNADDEALNIEFEPGEVRYLSLDWINALSAEVASSSHMAEIAAQHTIGVTQIVSGGPEGDVIYHLDVRDGSASFGAGPADPEDVKMEQSWETAAAVATGSLNAQEAFIKGHIRLYGDRQKLLDSHPVFGALDAVFATVRGRTRYE